MRDAMHELIGELLDAVMRGICIAITFSVVWSVAVVVIKKTPTALKLAGLW